MKTYELYPQHPGFSVKIAYYHGVELTSVRQAYALAYKGIWINPSHRYPVGITSEYDRRTGTALWCGCSGHGVGGGAVAHAAGIRAIAKFCAHANAGGIASRCSCTALGPGPHTKREIIDYERANQ